MASETALKLILRLIGTSSLTALVFVAAPRAWMASIHADLGMGELPDAPVVGYLTRSTSALYALLGGLFWRLSFDVRRFRPVLTYLGGAITLLGPTLLAVDLAVGVPAFWTWWEGPALTAIGLAIFVLSRDLERPPAAS